MRFYRGRQEHPLRNLFLSVFFFLIVCVGFYVCVDLMSKRSSEEQTAALQQAIHRGITQCYAIEGQYPESLEYLKENYGISYDSEKYFVDYQALGGNLMPDVTIIVK